MGPDSATRQIRNLVSRYLDKRSVLRDPLKPNKRNSAEAIALLVVASPLAVVLSLGLVIWRACSGRLRVLKLPIHGEFSFFIGFMEFLRRNGDSKNTFDIVLALSQWPHKTLTKLYRRELGIPILWSSFFGSIAQQALLMQPACLVCAEELPWGHIHYSDFTPSVTPVSISENLLELRAKVLSSLRYKQSNLICLAVHTRTYDLERNPKYALKGIRKESIGNELCQSVDFLESQQMNLLLLGSPDVGITHVPRPIPRLSDFGSVGGPHEVALASAVRYFWSDGVGAWWLAFPFKRPVIFSNQLTLRIPAWMWPQIHLVVPVRYQGPDGRALTLRDELSSRRPLASVKDVTWLRNSPEEIVEAHEEMLALTTGSWQDTEEISELREKYVSLFSEFPNYHPCRIASSFLKRYPHLVA